MKFRLHRRNPEYEVAEPCFDADYYLENNPDVASSRIDPLKHFMNYGWREGRDPNPNFSVNFYLAEYQDVRDADCNPFVHYLRYGKEEGRKCMPDRNPWPESEKKVVRPFFDSEFYLATNPMLSGDKETLLDHFVRQGWHENRDPRADFSISMYLANNPDVREAGINPFLHYIADGRAEGRYSWPSQLKPRAVVEAEWPSMNESGPRVAVVVMVKNEADIIAVFLSHVLELFDLIVVIDHGSSDGTLEVLQQLEVQNDSVIVYTLEEAGYIQALATNYVLDHLHRLRDADWIFALDADEFLPFQSRDKFKSALRSLEGYPVIAMHWKNLVPTEYWEGEVTFDGKEVLAPDKPSPLRKIAFQPAKIENHRFWLEQGNHTLLTFRKGEEIPAHDAFPLYHLPVRSSGQTCLKLAQGSMSYLALGKSRNEVQGAHWFKITAALAGRTITNELLNGVIDTYGTLEGDLPIISVQELEANGYSRQPLALAQFPLRVELPFPIDFSATILTSSAKVASQGANQEDTEPTQLECGPERNLKAVQGARGIQFNGLPPTPPTGLDARFSELNDSEFLAEFLLPSYWRIEHLVTTAWGGHMPLLFCLVNLLRPRRFVELGTHYGASFFAYCQAVRKLAFESEAIAVDCWAGDDHTLAYGEDVFTQFKYYLRQYSDIASYIRDYFSNAAKTFAAGSIDLLHIDGLHTYEAVRSDFETWRPKMSDQGIVMFHDINGYTNEFGVWKLWREIKDRYPTVEFQHSNGLGVALLGSIESSPMKRLLGLLDSRQDLAEQLQWHFQCISELQIENFVKTRDLKIKTEQVYELAGTRQKLIALEQELNLTKRKLSASSAFVEPEDRYCQRPGKP